VRDWLRGGLAAARIAADRAELWIPGAIVSFAFAGWVVFLAVVASRADENDVMFLGIRLAASPWWPWNLVAVVAAVLSGIGTMLLAIAFGEVALQMELTDARHDEIPVSVTRAMAALGVAGTGVAIAAAVLVWLSSPAFVEAWTEPDPATPYLVRVAAAAFPALLALAAVAVPAQAFGAVAMRRPWREALVTLRRRAHRLIPQAALTMALFLVAQLMTAIVLDALWRPLSGLLAAGGLLEPSTPILLLGFVWIWLVLVILAGVIQAWIAAWWNRELERE
jgi:hypothetical protein